jgi:hypothetical protein
MKRLLLALAFALAPAVASAQCNGVFPPNTVCGTPAGTPGLPFAISPSALQGSAGGTNGQIQYNNGGTLGGFGPVSGDVTLTVPGGVATIQPNAVTSSKIADGAVSGGPGGKIADGTITAADLAPNIFPIYASRAAAAALDLSAFSAIRTLGYSQPGDGGGAVFQKTASPTTPFIDSYITTFTIAGGSGYTNGSYFGIVWQTGSKPYSIGTVTVAGGVVTAANIQYTPGNQCTVGDVLTTSGIPGGTGASLTVTGCSTPLASFTDTAGNRWQYKPDLPGHANVLQFGAKGDWNGTDAGATDNFNAIQSASWFAGFKSSTSFDSGGFWGGKVIFPSGSYMAGCGSTRSLVVAQSVIWESGAEVAATIKMCDSFNSLTHFIEICDPNWHFACFGSRLRYISVFSSRNISASNQVYMIHTNNVQDFGGLDHVYIYAGQRGCTWFEKGFGGASTVQVQYVSCNGASTLTHMMRFGNTVASGLAYGTTIFEIKDLVLGGPSSCTPTCQTQPGILLQGGGFFDIAGVHCENSGEVCITVDIPATGNGDLVRLHNINAGSSPPATACTGVIQLNGTNVPGNTIVGMTVQGSCSNTVTNLQPGATSVTGSIVLDRVFNP